MNDIEFSADPAKYGAGFEFIYEELDWRRPRLIEATPDFEARLESSCWVAEARAAAFWGDMHPADRGKVLTAVVRSKCERAPLEIAFRMLHPRRGEVRMTLEATPERVAGGVRWRGVAMEAALPVVAAQVATTTEPRVLESLV